MKTLLFINGCVRGDNSRTLKMAKAYLDFRMKEGDIAVIERNLCGGDVNFLSEKSFDCGGNQLESNFTFAEEFANADEILLATPFWEFLFPAVVSCYFECVSIAGKTFCYTENGSKGLCLAKSFKYIYSAGDYLSQDDKLSEIYLKKLTNLYGIENFSAILADGLDIFGNDAEKIICEICEKIKNGDC